jgi:hypothetical protein
LGVRRWNERQARAEDEGAAESEMNGVQGPTAAQPLAVRELSNCTRTRRTRGASGA